MRSSKSDIVSEINIYKSKTKIEQSQLENFVRYLDQVVFKKYFFFCSPHKASVAPSFQRAFKTLSDYQQADYYLACYKIIYELKKSKDFVQQSYKEPEQVEMQYRRQTQSKIWKKTGIIMNYDKVELQVTSLNLKLKLQNYIIRRSNSKNKFAFVLQSTNAQCEPVTLRLSHPNAIQLESLLIKMRGLVNAGLKLKISKIIGLSRKSRQFVNDWYEMNQSKSVKIAKSDPQQQKSLRGMLKNKISIDFDIPINRNSHDKIPSYLIDQELIQKIDNFQQFEEITKGVFYHLKRERVKKLITFDSKMVSMQNLGKQLFKHQRFKTWKKSLYTISLIGDVSKENTKFYHEINIYKDCNEVDYVYLRHRFEQDNKIYFIDKSIATSEYGSHENSNSRGKIEYCIWRIKQKSHDCVELIVEIELTHIPSVDVYLAMSEQIGEIQNILSSKQIVPAIKRKLSPTNFSFISMDEGNFSISMEVLNELQSFEGVQMKTPVQKNDLNQESSFYSIVDYQHQQEIENTNINQELFKNKKQVYKYQLFPFQLKQKSYKQFKEGKFFNFEQCVVNDIGDLVFTNQQKIKAQSSIIKSVLKRIGANMFTGKSILNVSLPIQIFASDTNLQRLCRGMAYAPIFLQNKEKATPLQRMKSVICFAIGNLLLYIQMAKPFNPILGETYQTFIDGCPVYGEQISHHPPISSLYMVGRGYQVSAKIQAKVQLGLNSASGLNDGCFQVVFGKQKGNKSGVVFTSPPGELSGVIYGERKLNIIQKSQFFDYQNKLYCQIGWGKSKSTNTVGRYHDYLQGRIVELSRASSNIAKIKENDKDIVLGHITGRWTQVVYFNGEPIFEINKVKPFMPVEETKPLLSDSFFREDRQLVEEGKFVQAQAAKQRWQQIQRRDRKLRKQNQ